MTISSIILPLNDLPSESPVLVGISGGMDSVLLLVLLAELGLEVHAAHVNYGLRAAESDGDEILVRELTTKLEIPLHVHSLAKNSTPLSGIQEWARKVRYEWFGEIALQIGARTVLTAHHLDDQVETMLMNLGRGTGPVGLGAMSPERPLSRGSDVSLLRPLLNFKRSELADEAARRELTWREDASNTSPHFSRSSLRLELKQMPSRDYDELLEAGHTLSNSVRRVRDQIRSELNASQTKQEPTLQVADLLAAGDHLAKWIVMEMITLLDPHAPRRTSIVDEVLKLLGSHAGKKVEVGGLVIWREREQLKFIRSEAGTTDANTEAGKDADAIAVSLTRATPWKNGTLEFLSYTEEDLPSLGELKRRSGQKNVVFFDAGPTDTDFTIRAWRAGDRFQPFGMSGTKKIKAFLTDERVASSEKNDIPVLLSGNEVVWVVGHRLDDRFKVSSATKRVVRCTWIPNN